MKKLIVTLIAVLLLCVQGCANNGDNSLTTWVWGSEAISTRVGYLVNEEEDTEVGLSVSFWEDDDEPRVLGLYALRYLPDAIQIPNPIVLNDWLPETLSGSPYLGAKLERNLDLSTTALSPVAGITLEKIFFIEYQPKSFQEQVTGSDINIGVRWEF